MPCKTIHYPNVTVIACSRGRARRKACSTPGCRHDAAKFCDYPLHGPKGGSTCDRALCLRCARPQGGEVDYCPAHERMAKAGVK